MCESRIQKSAFLFYVSGKTHHTRKAGKAPFSFEENLLFLRKKPRFLPKETEIPSEHIGKRCEKRRQTRASKLVHTNVHVGLCRLSGINTHIFVWADAGYRVFHPSIWRFFAKGVLAIIPRFDLNVSNWADSLTFRESSILDKPFENYSRSLISIINVRSKDIYMRTHVLSMILSYIW